MSKELEALDYFLGSYKEFLKGKNIYCQITLTREQATEFIKEVDEVNQALQRLEFIYNANSSEALEQLKELHELAYGNDKTSWKIDEIRMSSYIKNYILKSQEQEKALDEIQTIMDNWLINGQYESNYALEKIDNVLEKYNI